MRIWAFPSFYPYNYKGMVATGIFAHRQYKGMIQNGAELSVVVPIPWHPVFPFSLLFPDWKKYQKMAFPSERIYDGIKVYHPKIANMRPNRFVKKTFSERYIDAIVNFFKDRKIKLDPENDFFYSQWLPDSALVQIAAHKLGVKSGVLYIGDDVALWPHNNEASFRLFEKTLLEADLRFSCAGYLGEEANRLIGKDLPFHITRWGVDYNFFKPVTKTEKTELRKYYNIPDDKVVVLNIGTASVRKGWIELFDALEKVKKNITNFLFVAVHTSKPDFDFAEEAKKRNLDENFLDIGSVAPDALNKIYNIADIFCLPSYAEGIANVVIEAMSSALAVITTHVGGHPEIINGKNGILIPPKEAHALYEKLLELISDKKLREEIGVVAREYIIREWGDYERNAKVIYEKFSML